jgi:hypothetical protein
MRLTTSHDRLVAPVQLSSSSAGVVVVAALLMIFGVDRVTDAAPVQHLYYLAIIFAGLRFRMRGGAGAALAAILLYHVANPHLLTLSYGERDLGGASLMSARRCPAPPMPRSTARRPAVAIKFAWSDKPTTADHPIDK